MDQMNDCIAVSDVPPDGKSSRSSLLELLSFHSDCSMEKRSFASTNTKSTITLSESYLESPQSNDIPSNNSRHRSKSRDLEDSNVTEDSFFSLLLLDKDDMAETKGPMSDTMLYSPNSNMNSPKMNLQDNARCDNLESDGNQVAVEPYSYRNNINEKHLAANSFCNVYNGNGDDSTYASAVPYSPDDSLNILDDLFETTRDSEMNLSMYSHEQDDKLSADTVLYLLNDSFHNSTEKLQTSELGLSIYNDQTSMSTVLYSPNDSIYDPTEEAETTEITPVIYNKLSDDDNSVDTVPYSPNDSLNDFSEELQTAKEYTSVCNKKTDDDSSVGTLPYSPNDSIDDFTEKLHIDGPGQDMSSDYEFEKNSVDTALYSFNDSISDSDMMPQLYDTHVTHDDNLQQPSSFTDTTVLVSASDTSDLLGILPDRIHNTYCNSTGSVSPLFNGRSREEEGTDNDETNFFNEILMETSKNPDEENTNDQSDMSDSLTYLSGSGFGSDLLLDDNTEISTVLPSPKNVSTLDSLSTDNNRKRKGSLLESNLKERMIGNNSTTAHQPVSLYDYFFDRKHIEIGKDSSSLAFTAFSDKKPLTKHSNETNFRKGHEIDNSSETLLGHISRRDLPQ